MGSWRLAFAQASDKLQYRRWPTGPRVDPGFSAAGEADTANGMATIQAITNTHHLFMQADDPYFPNFQ